jgi:isohexenylglutaconyl-CoA hydratase
MEIENNVAIISLNRTNKANSINQLMATELKQAAIICKDSNNIRSVLLTSSGQIFCAGGDLKSFKSGLQGDNSNLADVEKMSESTGEFFELINTIPVPVIMLAEGAAMAGGLGMLCAADIVVVTKDCKFALTETTLGIVPAQIAPYIVSRVGLSKARRLMLTIYGAI